MQTIDYKHTIYIGENCPGIFTSDLPIKNGDVPSQTIQLPEGKTTKKKTTGPDRRMGSCFMPLL